LTEKDRRLGFFLVFTAPLLAYLGLIAVMSHQEKVDLPVAGRFDKVVHCLEYMPVGFLILRWIVNRSGSRSRITARAMAAALILGILYAVTDEIHQAFIPRRSAELLDVAADGIGVLAGCSGYAWIRYRFVDAKNRSRIKFPSARCDK